MVAVQSERLTSYEESPPLTREALVFLYLLQQSTPITNWEHQISLNPQIRTLFEQATVAAQLFPGHYSLENFLNLHAKTFPENSISLLKLSIGLLDDLVARDIYFISDLIHVMEMGDFTTEDLISSLSGLDKEREETPEGLIALLQFAVIKEKRKRGMQVNNFVF